MNILSKDIAESIEPAKFEEIDPESTQIVRAKGRTNRSTESSYAPPLARNVIGKSVAELTAESVNLFESWSAVENGTEQPNESLSEAQEVEAEILEEPEATQKTPAEIEKDWEKRLERAVEDARAEGYRMGFKAAELDHGEDLDEAKKLYQEGLNRLQATWSSFISRSETLLLEIAIETAQFLLDVPLPERFSKLTEEALVDALDSLSHDVPVRLSLNPVDLMRMQESGMTRLIEEQFPVFRWDPQPTLKEGNWIVQTPRQAIRRVSEELLDNLRDRFGLADNSAAEEEARPMTSSQRDQHIPPVTNVSVSTSTAPQGFNNPYEQTSSSTVSTTARGQGPGSGVGSRGSV